MKNNISEIIRIKKLMGLKSPLKEGYYNINKILLKEDTGYGEMMAVYKKLFSKAGQSLDETEQLYLKNFIDEYNLRFGDEFGELTYVGKIDDVIRKELQRLVNEESDDVLTNLFSASIKRNERASLAKKTYELIDADDIIKSELMSRDIDPENLIKNDGTPISVLDIMVYITSKGGKITDSGLSEYFYRGLRDEFERVVDELADPENPVSKMLLDLMDQIDEIEEGTIKMPSADEIADVTNNLNAVKNSIENPIPPTVIDDVADDFTIDLGGDNIGLGRDPLDSRTEAIDAVMKDMEKKCKVGFCKTMVAYWKTDNKKFEDMWSYIYNKLSAGIKPKAQSRFYGSISQPVIDEFEVILKEFGKKDTPFTPDDYIKLGEEIYKKMKESNQLGVFGGTFTPFKDLKVFTSKDMMYRTLGYITLGTDPFKGGWTFKGMWDRWWKMNLIWFPIILTKNIIETSKGSEDPTETGLDQFVNLLMDTAEDVLFLGFAPGPRIFLEITSSYINKKVGGSKYVDYPTLVDYLNKQHGWTENQIYDNLINKNLVRTFRDSTPPFTQISGATDVFEVANGKYEIINKSLIGGLLKPKVVFTPQGSTTLVQKQKQEKITVTVRNEIKDMIGERSFLSSSIAKNLIGKKKIDYDRQESITDAGTTYTILIYKVTNLLDEKAEFSFNYDVWVADSKPEIESDTNFNKYVKVKLL